MFDEIIFVGDYLPDSRFSRCGIERWGAVVANLEAVICDNSPVRGSKAYNVHVGSTAFELIAESGVSAFNLANNHVYDAGPEMFEAMLIRLKDLRGIQFFGLREYPYAVLPVAGNNCAVIGCLEKCRARGSKLFPMEEVSDLIRQIHGKYDRIYVTPHWGKESEMAFHPSPAQVKAAEAWILAGADGVFGHHPHTIHGFQKIDGRPVYYSLGNYQFEHIEGREYAASSWGMSVRLSPSDAIDTGKPYFFLQRDGDIFPASTEAVAFLEEHFARLSRDLQVECYGQIGWARAISNIYLRKSRNSWRKRLKARFAKVFPLWLIWNLMPQTLLFRLAALLPHRDLSRRLKNANLELMRLRDSAIQ